MSHTQDTGQVRQAIATRSPDARSMLFVWLSNESSDDYEFADIVDSLLEVSERTLAHLVVHRGLAQFPESDSLSLYALRLEQEKANRAA